MLALPGCAAAEHDTPPPPPPAEFETRLDLKDAAGKVTTVFSGRDPITMVVTIRNRSDAPRTLTLPTSQTHDCVVYAGEKEVWRWSAGRMFAQVITELKFAPGEARSFTVTWDRRDRRGALLTAGEYRAVGTVPRQGMGMRSEPASFTVL